MSWRFAAGHLLESQRSRIRHYLVLIRSANIFTLPIGLQTLINRCLWAVERRSPAVPVQPTHQHQGAQTMTFRVGLNPLPWVLTPNGFELSVSVLRDAFGEISQTPFIGIHADPPDDLDADGYRKLLTEFGLIPAPGYFSADFADVATETVVEAAKRHAAVQAALGNTEVFIANGLAPARRDTPAVGADADDRRLQAVIDRLSAA
jgi:hypothetical protein